MSRLLSLLRRPAVAAAATASVGAVSGASLCWGSAKQTNAVTREVEVGGTKWLKLVTQDYVDEKGDARKWDMAHRAGKPGVVAVLAMLGQGNDVATIDADMLLTVQFRPPLNALALELPAAIMQEGESAEACAIRVLKAETGYVGTVRRITQPAASSCGLTDEAIQIAVVNVDLSSAENKKPGKVRTVNNRKLRHWPRQDLKDGEFIKVLRIKVHELDSAITQAEGEGVVPWVGLRGIAIGLDLARTSIF